MRGGATCRPLARVISTRTPREGYDALAGGKILASFQLPHPRGVRRVDKVQY